MQYASIILSILALAAVAYLFWSKPWKVECEDCLHKAKRFAEDGDSVIANGMSERFSALEAKPTAPPELQREKAKLPTIPEWRASRKKIAENA